ncbi:hypothetical protein LINPERHAP1_LOCUS29468 [Linum perenne]
MADELLSLSFLSSRPGEYPEVEEEDFYEKIQAPKYIDLTKPDSRRSGDDRYWFCLRVGCDQKHEEEMDSEAVYKNFVLRVMAARSPNVRLRRALCNKDNRSSLRCPQTVPAKPSRPRMAMISSISKKLVDTTVKVKKPLSKQISTPNLKARQPSTTLAKALTTPRNRKPVFQDPASFRSVRNPKAITALGLPKKREVAKTLVFHSPKKQARKTKTPPNEIDNVKTLCAGMKKLEITDGKKQVTRNKTAPLDGPKKQFRGREVKSRVYDGLLTPIQVHKQAGSSKYLEEKNKVRSIMHQNSGHAACDMEIEEKCKNGPQRIEISGEVKIGEEPVLASSGSENQCEAAEGDDKENALVSNEYRPIEHNDGHLEKNNQDNLKGTKTPRTIRKPFKESCVAPAGTVAAQGLKHLKPKPTHPKPFRLRTDERGILKEANNEKKLLHPTPVKENATTRFPKANLQKGHEQKNGKQLGETELGNEVDEINKSQREKQQQQEACSLRTPKKRGIATPNKHTLSSQKKAVSRGIINTSIREAAARKTNTASKKAKQPER